MKIKKKHLELVFKVLHNTKLSLVDSRIRDPFLKDLSERFTRSLEDRKKIMEEYCKKDAEGVPELTTDANKAPLYHFDGENIPKVQGELTTLSEEEEEFDLPQDKIEKIVSFMEATTYEPAYGESEQIDETISGMLQF